MTQRHRKRLAKLSTHIRTVPPEQWNFETLTASCGCALGHAHEVFPKEFNNQGDRVIHRSGAEGYRAIAKLLFGLKPEEAERLFGYHMSWDKTKAVLPHNATIDQVADNIDTFLTTTK